MYRTKKRFGQHFLKDASVLESITQYCQLSPESCCVEIGPGQGALTRYLVKTNADVHAIEIDRDLIPGLDKIKAKNPNFSYTLADVLSVSIETLFPKNTISLVGNLPYEISTPLLFKLIPSREKCSSMVFLLQKEVVDRICATVGSNDYGRLSVMMQYYFSVEALRVVEKEAFHPPPKVVSQVVRLVPLIKNWVDHEQLENFVKYIFAQKRKMLRQRFKDVFNAEDWACLGIVETQRPQSLTVDQIINMLLYCQNKGIDIAGDRI